MKQFYVILARKKSLIVFQTNNYIPEIFENFSWNHQVFNFLRLYVTVFLFTFLLISHQGGEFFYLFLPHCLLSLKFDYLYLLAHFSFPNV